VSAAIEPMNVSTHSVGVDAEVGISIPVDLEIIVYGGLDPVTQDLIDSVREAVDRLYKEYGIEAVFTPRIVYWDVFAFAPVLSADIPVLVINGKEVIRGRSTTSDEIIQIALSMLGVREREKPLPLLSKRDGEVFQAALTA